MLLKRIVPDEYYYFEVKGPTLRLGDYCY